jgi:hypothetical protein
LGDGITLNAGTWLVLPPAGFGDGMPPFGAADGFGVGMAFM